MLITDLQSMLQAYDSERQAHLPTELNSLEDDLIAVFDITSANTTISPKNLKGLTTVNWGDGTVETINDTTGTLTYSHTYANVGKYVAVFKGVTEIGTYSFSNTLLTKIKLGSNITTLGPWCFSSCTELENILFGEKITSFANNVFRSCSKLEKVILPESATSFNFQLFFSCSNLKEIVFGTNTTSLGDNIFQNCTKLKKVIIKAITPPSLSSTQTIPSNCLFYVPLESLNAYKTATNWVTYASRIVGIVDTNYLDSALSNVGGGMSVQRIQLNGDVAATYPKISATFINSNDIKAIQIMQVRYDVNEQTHSEYMINFPVLPVPYPNSVYYVSNVETGAGDILEVIYNSIAITKSGTTYTITINYVRAQSDNETDNWYMDLLLFY